MSFSKSVLVIEDEPDLRITLEYFLGKIGYEVLAAGTGEEGLQIAREKLPRVVLCDVQLPGILGFEVCRILKTDPATRNIPVVFVSSSPRGELESEGGKAGAELYISKPVDPKDIGSDLYFLFEQNFDLSPENLRNLRVSRPTSVGRTQSPSPTPIASFAPSFTGGEPDPFADDNFPSPTSEPSPSASPQRPTGGSTESNADRIHRRVLTLCQSQKSLLARGGDFRKAIQKSVQELEQILSEWSNPR